MKNENNGVVIRPFGPSIAKVTIPPDIVKKFNDILIFIDL